uniref:Reverse transcriptase/retrotransposon-derived protein RNase H-like domain-containing protein n=1 Tax=Solanum lycopersicum TaxID=4081 RepID=A0A3Q7G549_SOLLC
MEKCEFAQQEIKFLGHLVSKNNVRMDPKKVQAIVDWQASRHVNYLRSFLGLANYYRKFIAGYSKRAAALSDLLKNDTKWNLKEAIASEPILKLPDFELPFEVHIDASDKVIGGVLV